MNNNIQIECKRCGNWYGSSWDEKGGCPSCQGFIGYPYKFMETEEYKREIKEKINKQRQEYFDRGIKTISPETMSQEDFDFIVTDLLVTEWRDSQAAEMVERLVRHILATDKNIVKTNSRSF